MLSWTYAVKICAYSFEHENPEVDLRISCMNRAPFLCFGNVLKILRLMFSWTYAVKKRVIHWLNDYF